MLEIIRIRYTIEVKEFSNINDQYVICEQTLYHFQGGNTSMSHNVGQQLGSYRLIRHLGKGGFAEVYLGEHIHLRTQAAIKVIHAFLGQQEKDLFLTEARTVARLAHPHIIHVHDFGIEGTTLFLIMDYASKGALS
jgi:eukaryotic-like serine/threonine-protein kinase